MLAILCGTVCDVKLIKYKITPNWIVLYRSMQWHQKTVLDIMSILLASFKTHFSPVGRTITVCLRFKFLLMLDSNKPVSFS